MSSSSRGIQSAQTLALRCLVYDRMRGMSLIYVVNRARRSPLAHDLGFDEISLLYHIWYCIEATCV